MQLVQGVLAATATMSAAGNQQEHENCEDE